MCIHSTLFEHKAPTCLILSFADSCYIQLFLILKPDASDFLHFTFVALFRGTVATNTTL